MKSMSRLVALLVVSFAAASAFSTDAPLSTTHAMQNVSPAAPAVSSSDGTVRALNLVKCTNPRECSVG
jgi:hypothetical protein